MNDRAEQIRGLLERATQGVRSVFESEKYKKYLSAMSKFHKYSYNNTLLILLQRPDATYVAGYTAWQTKFHRQVQKGETGIQIIGYTPRRIQVDVPQKDPSGNPVLDAKGHPVVKTEAKQIPAYTPVYVFDVTQTTGEPLPKLANELDGSVASYSALEKALHSVSPFPIVFEEMAGAKKGYCDYTNKKIAVKSAMGQAQTVKTIIHEITHADLHAPNGLSLEIKPNRRTAEIEAESTAFVVCDHYGIDTSDYSFPYLASWSGGKELPELQASLERIHTQAADLIDRLDASLTDLQVEKPLAATVATPPDRTFSLYKLTVDDANYARHFLSFDQLTKQGESPVFSNYAKIYEGPLPGSASVDNICNQLIVDPPKDYTGGGIYVGDVIVVSADGHSTASYIDEVGYQDIPVFAAAHEQALIAAHQDSVKFDGDIDLDKEKNRSQLGYKDGHTPLANAGADKKPSMKERMASAKERSQKNNSNHLETSKERGGPSHDDHR